MSAARHLGSSSSRKQQVELAASDYKGPTMDKTRQIRWAGAGAETGAGVGAGVGA